MRRQLIKFLKTHAEIFIPGVGTLKQTLPPDNRTLESLVMTRTELGGVLLEIKAAGVPGTAVVEIPSADVAYMVYGNAVEIPDEVKPPCAGCPCHSAKAQDAPKPKPEAKKPAAPAKKAAAPKAPEVKPDAPDSPAADPAAVRKE
jgi:hypothetical protein